MKHKGKRAFVMPREQTNTGSLSLSLNAEMKLRNNLKR